MNVKLKILIILCSSIMLFISYWELERIWRMCVTVSPSYTLIFFRDSYMFLIFLAWCALLYLALLPEAEK